MAFGACQVKNIKRHLPILVLVIFFYSSKANGQWNGDSLSESEVLLTCMFSENIEDKKQPFRIFDDQSEEVLKCTWVQKEFFCKVGDGYRYDWRLTDKVTVTKLRGPKPNVCSCFLVDQDSTQYERPCTVQDSVEHLEDKKELQTLPFELVEDNLLERPLLEDIPDEPDRKSDNSLLIAATALAVILMIISVTLAAILVRRRHRNKMQKGKDSKLSTFHS